jgi:branched-chain amino acid transport system permease protein
VGFTLFFGVLNVIQFAHGDFVMLGAYIALGVFWTLSGTTTDPIILLICMGFAAATLVAAAGSATGRLLVLPLRSAPPINVLLITLMLGTAVREAIRLFVPGGANPKRFPELLPSIQFNFDRLTVRADSILLFAAALLLIVLVHLLINRTRLGLAIRAVSQDDEVARLMGVNYVVVVLATFAIGSALAAMAGLMNGLYYGQLTFDMGLVLGVIGFSAAIIGGLGNFFGALFGGFLFAILQFIGTIALPVSSAYRDVFAFLMVIVIMTWRPTGLIGEKISERV